jgi:hypothetical protein
MNRYSTARIIKNPDLKRYLTTVIIPTQPLESDDIYIQTTTQDRLDRLAYIFYEDESMWWIIAIANGLGKGTYVVPPNTRLRIPNKLNIQQNIIDTNNER